jgi:hypothetical protein
MKLDGFAKILNVSTASFRRSLSLTPIREPESSAFTMFWMPVEDPVFSGDQVRHDEI